MPVDIYYLPRVLWDYGILKYHKELEEIIDNGSELAHDSMMEIEIRACCIWTVELIKKEFFNRGLSYDAMAISSMIWRLGTTYKSKHLYHHTYTIYY